MQDPVSSPMESAEQHRNDPAKVMTDRQFRRRILFITLVALFLPPTTGGIVLMFVGVYPFPGGLRMFESVSSGYVLLCTLAALYGWNRATRALIRELAKGEGPDRDRLAGYLRTAPAILTGLLMAYFIGGAASANVGLDRLGVMPFDWGHLGYTMFAVVPAFLITALPIWFYTTDILGLYLGPRGMVFMVAPMWLKLSVLGLFTPVMIDTLLITYYYDRTGYFTGETFTLWLLLIIIAGVGSILAWRSFRQSLKPVEMYLTDEDTLRGKPIAQSLDEIGRLTTQWGQMIEREALAHKQAQILDRRYQELVEALPLGVMESTPDGVVTLVNSSFCRILECSQDSVIGNKVWNLGGDDFFCQKIRDHLTNSAGSPVIAPLEGNRRHRDGRVIHFRMDWIRKKAGDGSLQGYIAIVADISEQRVAEQQIRDLNQTLEQGIETRTAELEAEKTRAESYLQVANTMIVALDSDGTITMVNDKGCDILGWARADLIGKDWFETCLPATERATVRQVFGRILGGDLAPVESFENTVLTRNGDPRLISWHNSFLEDGAGSTIGCLSAGIDVTEQRRALEKLETNERRLTLSQQFSGIGVWEWNIVTGALYWSDQIGPLVGYKPGEVETTYENFLAVVHPEDRANVEKAVADCLKSGKMYEVEHRIIRADDGLERWLLERGNIVRDNDGAPQLMIGVVQDITTRKRQDDQLRHAQKIESLGNMAGGIAHSLNNLLLPIVTLSRMVMEDSPPESENRLFLSKVVEASDKAREMVARILAFSRYETPELANDDLTRLVNETMQLAMSSIPSTIRVEVDLGDDPIIIRMDGAQMEAVLMNLVSNAVAALSGCADGRLGVRLRAVTLAHGQSANALGLANGKYGELTVSDNGWGMDDETLERIFDPFFTTKPVGQGTGLGLAMAHGIVGEHHGAIGAVSEPGKGTTMKILLPLVEPKEKTRPDHKKLVETGSGGHHISES